MTRSADLPHMLGLLLALRRVQDGRVTVGEPEVFRDGGGPVPSELVPFLRELFAHGQVRLEDQQRSESPRVVMTTAGEELLAELEADPERPSPDTS